MHYLEDVGRNSVKTKWIVASPIKGPEVGLLDCGKKDALACIIREVSKKQKRCIVVHKGAVISKVITAKNSEAQGWCQIDWNNQAISYGKLKKKLHMCTWKHSTHYPLKISIQPSRPQGLPLTTPIADLYETRAVKNSIMNTPSMRRYIYNPKPKDTLPSSLEIIQIDNAQRHCIFSNINSLSN